MLRTFFGALVALVLCAGGLLADELTGKVKKVDTEKNTLTVTVADKDMNFEIPKDTRIQGLVGKGKKATYQDLAGGLGAIKEGKDVLVLREKKDGKEVVTQVRVVDVVQKKK